MPSYNIERWDSVIPPGHTQPLPMIYIKPDEEFIALAKDNNYNVIVTISNTGKLYDTKPIPGVIDSSGYFPDFRPNFFNNTKLMVITLLCDWIGYPENGKGSVCVHGATGRDKVNIEVKPYQAPKPLPWLTEFYKNDDKSDDNKLSMRSCISVILIIIIFLLILSLFNNK
jgi:hypothetical protein